MVFYAIRLGKTPRIRFACSDTTPIRADSGNIIDHRRDMIEISTNNTPLHITTEYGSRKNLPGKLSLYMPDCRYELRQAEGADRTMVMMSIAVESAGMAFTRYDLPPEKIAEVLNAADSSTIFLEETVDCDEEENQLFISQLQVIMQHYSIDSTAERLLALSGWFELCAMLDARFRRTVSELEQHRDSGELYVYKAKRYICSHLGEELHLDRIAGELGISVPYFSSLFRRITGHTVTDFIGNMRCQQIRDQILRTDDSFPEICARFGLHGRRYAQRLFKKHFGISMQRCRQLGRGISLYHENPWKRDHVEQDIYEQEEK
ncbi:MAG: helix-turn-helix transcriptional regulator [Ruminococcaceae bacterium]|nr:helix-turn-helix transcriptional regulator [Oscillospiraceae bacterium]